ncbi:hypothetical protein Mp_1g18350 [Marchantia polymorpha subsp. ruderalis]|uniref:Uncharacterized protein n=2 Tax=Marchantia polymorpha TaxID=3197 RepID=A0AAF6ARI6_MARPO|nr:hypothetical protein MARPO_0001s0173 [Marchantia polymorpha]BBM99056.1 hypothetical protein Mp_1g18350 [Marchantia polymorpha subsp. ruderalis]|eukprot:PTQ50132.1 hypothetical protein MARPO_0001s0173 [Marchantia polymorpha]
MRVDPGVRFLAFPAFPALQPRVNATVSTVFGDDLRPDADCACRIQCYDLIIAHLAGTALGAWQRALEASAKRKGRSATVNVPPSARVRVRVGEFFGNSRPYY